MDALEIFGILVEGALTLAGFAGIIATFQYGGNAKVGRGQVAALTVIVQLSLMTALLAGLPLVLHTFGLEGAALWGPSSVIATFAGLTFMYTIDRYMRPALKKRRFWLIYVATQSISFFLVLGVALNAANTIFHREPGPYLLGGVGLLSFAGYMFARLLLNPLWKRVRDGELSDAP